MATRTIYETAIEKLDPPTTVAGQTAYLAQVTRYYAVDVETGASAEYGTPHIVVEWNVTVQDKLAALDAEKLAVAARAADEAAKLDAAKEELSKAKVSAEITK